MRSCQLVGLRYLRQFPKRYSIKSPSTYERLARWPVRSPSLTLMEKMLASSPLRIWWHLSRGPTRYLVSSKFVDSVNSGTSEFGTPKNQAGWPIDGLRFSARQFFHLCFGHAALHESEAVTGFGLPARSQSLPEAPRPMGRQCAVRGGHYGRLRSFDYRCVAVDNPRGAQAARLR